MSIVSDAYDAIRTRLQVLFPEADGYFELTNPYDVTDNTKGFLRQGWGMAFGPVTNTNLLLCKTVTTDNEVRVLITRELAAMETDVERKHDSIKALLEDLRDVINDLDRADTLETIGVNILSVSTNGIETVRGDNFAYLYVELVCTVKFFDQN